MSFVAKEKEKLQAFSDMSVQTGARADYVQGGGGNTSVKLSDGLMAIKASGYKLSDIAVDRGYAVLDYEALRAFYETHEIADFGDVEKSGSDETKLATKQIEGLEQVRPSVEAGFHAILPTFVNHTHSVYANFAACCKTGREVAAQALADADYTFGFVPYTDPGSRLTFIIRDEARRVARETGSKPSVIFMQNHGVIATDDDMQRCLAIHDDANARIAAAFGKKLGDFPAVAISENDDGTFSSNTPYLRKQLTNKRFDTAFFAEDCLYPDQLVFLRGSVEVIDSAKGETSSAECVIDQNDGSVLYRVSRAKAQTIEETLTAVLFIVETIEASGREVSLLGAAAKSFIDNWESEKYRKSLAK